MTHDFSSQAPQPATRTGAWPVPAPSTPPNPYLYPVPAPPWQPDTANTSRWGIGLAIAAIVISLGAAATAGLTFVLFALGSGVVFEDEWGPESEGTAAALAGLNEGDCFNTVVGRPETVRAIDCMEPHDGEILLIGTLEGYPDEYPGAVEIGWAADEECYLAFEDRVGYGEDSWDHGYAFYAPDQRTWPGGDRAFACAIMPVRLGSLEGTVG